MSRSVVCENPACGWTVLLPDGAVIGTRYECPYCKRALPPTPEEPLKKTVDVPHQRRRKKRHEEDDEDDQGDSRLSTLNIMGIILLALGAAIAFIGIALDSTTSSGYSDRVHNLGLLFGKLICVLCGLAISIIGAIFFAASARRRL